MMNSPLVHITLASQCRGAFMLLLAVGYLFACTTSTHSGTNNNVPAGAPHGDSEKFPQGHHEHHRFDDAKKWASRFESSERDEWQKPDAVIEAMALEPNQRVADIGSATGYFPVRIAAAVPDGRVWGIDIEPDMVRYLNERARSEQIKNLFSVLGTSEDPLIPEPVDRILMVNTYHHISDRVAYFENLHDDLRQQGRIFIVDFKEGELPVGPGPGMKLSAEQVISELEKAGFRLAQHYKILPYQYILEFER